MEKHENVPGCPFNEGVGCEIRSRNCVCCGWNPAVSQHRLEQYCRENGIDIQKLRNRGCRCRGELKNELEERIERRTPRI